MNKKVESIKHPKETRAHIPSKEEAGYEQGSPVVADGRKTLELPKNPVVHRGQDPELFWLDKYGRDDRDELLRVDIRSLYRYEHIAPETLIEGLYKVTVAKTNPLQDDLFSVNELFGNALEQDELEKVSAYYRHHDGWTNRLIQGDSQLVMASLLEREGMAGQVQCIYIDPPYGIKYNSNWQMRLNDRNVKDGSDEHLSGEPEQIKAFRDTWELAIHSYLSYLRDRLLIAKELLHDSGSCFVQISDENVHLVRCVMDEVFGSENFVSLITFSKTSYATAVNIPPVCDYLLFYAKDIVQLKFRKLYFESLPTAEELKKCYIMDGDRVRTLNDKEIPQFSLKGIDKKNIPFQSRDLASAGPGSTTFPFIFKGKTYHPGNNRHWKTNRENLEKLANIGRLFASKNSLRYKRYITDFPFTEFTNIWNDTIVGSFHEERKYVVQTSLKVIQRCLLMTTDPGDLVLDPTCGSGTTAYVAEQWGRRWITIDTSRIALNIAKTRLMTAVFPYYTLHDEQGGDIRQGFVYKTVPHVTLKSLANDEPPDTETLYDQPQEDRSKLRVAGPLTVETMQQFEPVNPASLDDGSQQTADSGSFEERIFAHLTSAGVRNGLRNEQAVFLRVERLADSFLHAEGFYQSATGERKAYFHIGPKFGAVSKQAVNEAIKACRTRGDADWLILLGFSFESNISNANVTTSLGAFEVTKVRMHDDLMQDGLLKKDKKAASFVTIGEPDVNLHIQDGMATVEICGLDMYDPITDEVKARNVEDIAYWMVDSDYDGSNFVVRQVFFCGGDQDEFDKWRKGLDSLAKETTRKKAQYTLKIDIDADAFDRLYGFRSHPFAARAGQRIAVRVISQFGEESTNVLTVTAA